MYKLVRSLLFLLPAEASHTLALQGLAWMRRLGLLPLLAADTKGLAQPIALMGLNFPNPVGLAAGLDKNADYLDTLGQLGFGFIEVGTLTPKAQPGNPRPRLFRLPEHEALINRLGFNNKGIDHAVARIARSQYRGVIGVNIGKNFSTALDDAVNDYLYCLQRCYAVASYVTINLSSPNTPGLRELQFGTYLAGLLASLTAERGRLQQAQGRYVPLLLKLAPDLSAAEIREVADAVLKFKLDGVIATNTTVDRSAVSAHPLAGEAGGLSGAPLTGKATAVIEMLRQALGPELPIIGVGGIMTGTDGAAKTAAGANLLQIYTGFIYRGPALIRELLLALARRS